MDSSDATDNEKRLKLMISNLEIAIETHKKDAGDIEQRLRSRGEDMERNEKFRLISKLRRHQKQASLYRARAMALEQGFEMGFSEGRKRANREAQKRIDEQAAANRRKDHNKTRAVKREHEAVKAVRQFVQERCPELADDVLTVVMEAQERVDAEFSTKP